jgi:autotransporter-associated beta strand protein
MAMLVLKAASLLALIVALPTVAAAADLVWVGNDAFNSSNFTNSGNWQSNTLPSWGFANSLKFNQNQNSNVTGLNYNFGDWRQVNDIFWDSSFPVARTLSASNGGGINFKTRIENNSSFTQTVAMELSGGSDGASDIQLNPVNGSLIFSGTLWNDNSKDYVVYGTFSSTATTLTLNTTLGTNATQANVDFTVSDGRNSAVQVNASQVWAGTTTVNSGAFTTANGVTLASTAIVVGGGTFATTSANTLADTASLTVNTGRLSIGGSDTVASLAGSGGSVNLAAGATLTVGNASSTSYAGSITGSGNLAKVGSGTFTLSAASSMTGTTTVSAGQFSLGGSNLLADTSAVAVAGGVLALGGNSDTVGAFAISGGSLTGSGTVTAANYTLGGGTVSANLGSGTMNVTGNASLNGTSNGTTLNLTSGTLTLGSAGRLAAASAVAVNGSAGAALTLGGNETIGSLAGAANVAIGSNTLTVGGDNTSTTYSGSLNGAGSVTKVGNGTLTLTGANSNSGGTTVSGGQLIGTTSSLQGAITNNAAVTFAQGAAGTYAGLMSGSGSVMKTGAGVLEFTAANTYTGPTSVIDGGLRLNGSIAGSLNVALVASLSGTGTVGGDATIIGTHSPGNSPGAQIFNGNLTYQAGAVVNWELIANTTGSAGSSYDQIILPTGDLTFSGSTTLALAFNSAGSSVDWANTFWDVNRSWMVYDLSGGTTSNLSNLALGGSLLDSLGNSLSSTARGYFTTSLAGQDVMLNFVAVPEPSTLGMAFVGLACGGLLVRRRKRA